MEETLSWQAELAKSNINITGVQYTPNNKVCVVCFEFPYHPKPGQVKWFKTVEEYAGTVCLYKLAPLIKQTVLTLRKELEK